MEQITKKPPVWQMIKQAAEELGTTKTSFTRNEIREYIQAHWKEVNNSTVDAQITVLTVNSRSRIHYPENQKPRLASGQYDLLFSTGRGEVEIYQPSKHGQWEIRANEFGSMEINLIGEEQEEIGKNEEEKKPDEQSYAFRMESHLRDFLIQNLHLVNGYRLSLFRDETGRDGKEYQTDIGPIDILTVDEDGDFVVFELKVSRGSDSALGQIQRYMGWVKNKLANGKKVSGIILAKNIDEKLKYGVSVAQNITLMQYSLKFDLSTVGLLLGKE